MMELGLVAGTSGNISVRLPMLDGSGEILAITPSGHPYENMTENDIVVIDNDVEPIEGELAPSSESLLHVAIYQARPDVQAVIHTHSVFSSVAAVAGLDIPPVIDEVAVYVGGAIKVSEYGFPGSQELADNVVEALGDRGAALIRNHGAVGVGRRLSEALDVCVMMERVSQIFIYSTMLGKMNPLPPDVVEAERAIYNMRRG
jgi:L-fuculose-phosphate aldolase